MFINSLADAGTAASPILGLLIILFIFFIIVLSIGGTIFWIWALIDCATKEPEDGSSNKVAWLLVIVFTHIIGALLYFLIRRPERKRITGR